MKKLTIASIFLLGTICVVGQTEKDSLSTKNIETVEIFGDRNKNQKGLETVTRLPINPQKQPQSISVISEKLIQEQGALSITDAARNVPGVTLFGSYGGNRESMSIRGYRGTPVLKNGIRMDSDFRSGAGLIDMQGVESVQVLRGAASITQGLGNGLGSAGGLINIVTKTPRYINSTEVGLRAGSWNLFRATADAQRVLGTNKNVGVRLNAAYEQSDSYRDVINKNKFYINPSVSWKIDDKTEFIAEMDYLKGEGTPDRGTFNTKGITENGLVDFGSRFLGFTMDNEEYNTLSYSARITRQLTDKINVRAAWMANAYERDQIGVTLAGSGQSRNRGLARSYKEDNNSTLQVDVMGNNFSFGKFKWQWQVGYDLTNTKTISKSAAGITANQLAAAGFGEDITKVWSTGPINNHLDLSNHAGLLANLELGAGQKTRMNSYGFLTQQHLTYNDFVKFVGALRYSYTNDYHNGAVDPMVALMVMPTENINIYGSYATITSLRQMGQPMIDGSSSGPSVTDQFEVGVKTSWFGDRLRANINYFNMNQDNLTYQYYDPIDFSETDFYAYAGNLRRTGVDVEVTGRPLSNLQIILGYTYTDAGYHNSNEYVNGSRPMNAPYNTANAWAQYTFQNTKTFVDGLYVGLGYYYIGSRPVNEQTKGFDGHGNFIDGAKPFLMPEYYTLNAQLGYKLQKFNFKVFFNNITDRLGYNSYYRGGYINQIDPFNVSAQVTYKF